LIASDLWEKERDAAKIDEKRRDAGSWAYIDTSSPRPGLPLALALALALGFPSPSPSPSP